jgi:excisionase family DNA binding protein
MTERGGVGSTGPEIDLLKLKAVAEALNCSLSNVYARVQDGSLPVVRVGRSKGFRVSRADLERYLAERRSEGVDEAPCSLKHIKLP